MYEFHGFDPKTLSDEELFNKQIALTTKKMMAARFGKMQAVSQLQAMITAIEFERRERIFRDNIGAAMMSSSPVVVETEADLKPPVVEETKKPTNVEPRIVRRAIRTSKPVIP